MQTNTSELTFTALVTAIQTIHNDLKHQATQSVNVALTLRNWLIGYYIAEFEIKGTDRAEYGEKLIERLAVELKSQMVLRTDKRELYRYYQFFKTYPQIVETLSPQLLAQINISDTTGYVNNQLSLIEKHASLIVETVSPQLQIDVRQLVTKLSFSHISEFLNIEDTLKRSFYEFECIRGNWSVRQLRRQIASLYYERTGLSIDKSELAKQSKQNADLYNPALTVKDPYVFEFLGLKPREVMSESHLEDQLLDKLQDFLLELGHGFCFESRQKRILIGNTQYFIDLVFYHRILKCHILVELKLSEFNHEHIGQLNTYVSWYRKNIIIDGDNAPIGILLCTEKDDILVEYALAGMDNQLFVSQYLLELPKPEEIQKFIKDQMHEALGQD